MCAAVLPGPLTRPLVRLGSAYSNWLVRRNHAACLVPPGLRAQARLFLCGSVVCQLRNPVVSNFISGTVIVALGDAISQFVEGNAKSLGDLDQRRLFNAGEKEALAGCCRPWGHETTLVVHLC